MKNFIRLLILSMFLMNLPVFASYIEIQPTMNSRSNAQDRLWVGTFQLVWNDFMDKIVHNPVRFREGTPVLVAELNKRSFSDANISEKSYYKYTGKVKKDTKKQITKAIKKKFKESSDILDALELNPRNDMYIVYAMLKKDFEFIHAFDKLGNSSFGYDYVAEYFGIKPDSNRILAQNVKVLFYNNPDDYAVKLLTTGNDEVYLYKNASNKSFNYIYDDMIKKEKSFDGDKTFKKIDELMVPNIKISEQVVFDELTNRRIMGTNIVINKAVESIKFDMNNKGVKIKSEAGLSAEVTSLLPPEELVPRLFYFDNTFVIFLKEKTASKPYFALRVNDIRKFQEN